MVCQGQDDVEDITSERSILGRYLDIVCHPSDFWGSGPWVLELARQASH